MEDKQKDYLTPEERKKYNSDYRADGFGRVGDRRYYARHRDRHNAGSRAYYEKNKATLAAKALARYHKERP